MFNFDFIKNNLISYCFSSSHPVNSVNDSSLFCSVNSLFDFNTLSSLDFLKTVFCLEAVELKDTKACPLLQRIEDVKQQRGLICLEAEEIKENETVRDVPLFLSNGRNNCYLNSSLQLLCNLDLFFQNVEKTTVAAEAQEVQKILQRIQRGEKGLEQEFMSALFRSGLEGEFCADSYGRMLDADSAIGLFSRLFLVQEQIVFSKKRWSPALKGVYFELPSTTDYTLRLELNEECVSFQDLIQATFSRKMCQDENNPWICDPQEALPDQEMELNQEDLLEVLNTPILSLENYEETQQLKQLLSTLLVQFPRLQIDARGNLQKLKVPISLPSEGVIEVGGERESVHYKIKGYIEHVGGGNKGHYIAFIEKKGKYYRCDDVTEEKFKEISKIDFFSNEQAYYVALEKV